jgi:hypothetical protein
VSVTRQPYTVADLNPRGELQLSAAYRYEELEQVPGAAELIGHLAGCLWQSPDLFQTTIPEQSPTLTFQWRAASPTSGISILRLGAKLIWVSLLAAGLAPEQDALVLDVFQKQLLSELHDTGVEPAFALADLHQRPLMASFNVSSPPTLLEQTTAALADRCFAAAYFRYLSLA